MKRILYVVFALSFLGTNLAWAQGNRPLRTFKNTKWYISEMRTVIADSANLQTLTPERNKISFSDNNRYDLDFPEINDMVAAGLFVVENQTMTLSDLDAKKYMYVFNITKKTENEVIATYVPYKPTGEKVTMILRPLAQQEESPEELGGMADFSGIWKSRDDNQGVRLKIEQQGKNITGLHDSGGVDSHRFFFRGTVEGNSVVVTLFNQKEFQYVGQGRITKRPSSSSKRGKLSWEVVDNPKAASLLTQTLDGVSLKWYGPYRIK